MCRGPLFCQAQPHGGGEGDARVIKSPDTSSGRWRGRWQPGKWERPGSPWDLTLPWRLSRFRRCGKHPRLVIPQLGVAFQPWRWDLLEGS